MEKIRFLKHRTSLNQLIRWARRLALAVVVLSAVALLALLVWSTGNASRYAQQYDLLLSLNAVLAFTLMSWVAVLAIRLIRQIRRRRFGARLTARFTLYFTLIGILPGVVIYVLSVQFMSRSIESWFNVRVDSALEAGLNLGRAALDAQINELSANAHSMALRLNNTSDNEIAMLITSLREAGEVDEAMVFTGNGRLVAFSSADFGRLLPDLPPGSVMNQLRVSHQYAAAESNSGFSEGPASHGLQLRVVIPLGTSSDRLGNGAGFGSESRWLQLIRAVPEPIARNASQVQQGFQDYQELALSRLGLRKLYGITLTLALILAVFAAVVMALAVSRRLVRPLLTLASGTQAVGVGDYRPLPEPPARDEVGQLTRSFNAMTRQLDEARQMVDRHRRQLEQSNLYLESVLSNLSTGVLVFDSGFRLSLFNQGAQDILNVDLRTAHGRPLETVTGAIEAARLIRQAFAAHEAVESERAHWQQQFEIELQDVIDNERKKHVLTLLARGTKLRLDGQEDGYLVVFDDISEVISASRTVAWGEVARRLAHEIKNPLTPIQLSAERLAMKLADKLSDDDAAMLQRSTQTIVNQVSSLKRMVDDFREYARTPPAQMQEIDLNALLAEVLTLYGWDQSGPPTDSESARLRVNLDANMPHIMGDPAQLRQVIHNLLANARDAAGQNGMNEEISIQTRYICSPGEPGHARVRLSVSDNGPGFAPEVLSRVFEPYVTTKSTGTGLGLAIVRKIVEEHEAQVDISNRKNGGARISILFSRLANMGALDAQVMEKHNKASNQARKYGQNSGG